MKPEQIRLLKQRAMRTNLSMKCFAKQQGVNIEFLWAIMSNDIVEDCERIGRSKAHEKNDLVLSRHLTMFELRDEGYSVAEIADRLNISRKTVRSTLARAARGVYIKVVQRHFEKVGFPGVISSCKKEAS